MRVDAPFTGIAWRWLGNLTPKDVGKIEHPEQYTLELRPNGWFNFKADCKAGTGMYEISNGRITLAVIKVNRAKPCPAGPSADDFIASLGAAGSFRFAGEKLYFDMKHEAKTMVFWKGER
jgi:hypothetical protein